MSTLKRYLKNSSALTIARVVQPVFSYLLIFSMTYFLGTRGVGQYTTVFTYYTVFQIFASYGFRTLLAREVARHPDCAERYLFHATVIVLPFSLINIAAMILLVKLLGYEPYIVSFSLLLSVAIFAHALNDVFEGFFIGIQKIDIIAYLYLCENILRVIVSIGCLYLNYGILTLFSIFVVVKFLAFIVYIMLIRKHIHTIQWRIQRETLIYLIRQSSAFFFTIVFATVFAHSSTLMLSKFGTEDDVGLFYAAHRFFWLMTIVLNSVVISFFPIISKSFQDNFTAFIQLSRKALKYIILFCVPVVLFFYLFANEIIVILYPDEFLDSVSVLQILILSILFYGISELFGHVLMASNRQRLDMVINGIKMLIIVILNFILIPRLGYDGAAWAISIAVCINLLIQVPFVARTILQPNFNTLPEFLLKFFPFLVIGVLIVFVFNLPNWLAFLLFITVYVTGIILLNLISVEDRRLILNLIQNRK